MATPTAVPALPEAQTSNRVPWPTFTIPATERAAISTGALRQATYGKFLRGIAAGTPVVNPVVNPVVGPYRPPTPPAPHGAKVIRSYSPTGASASGIRATPPVPASSGTRVIRTHKPPGTP